MKKLVIAAVILGMINAGVKPTKVVNDTTVIKSNVRFDKETFVGNKGSYKETYQVLVDGKWYSTTKTSYERYFLIKKYNGIPTVVFVKSKNNTKVVVL